MLQLLNFSEKFFKRAALVFFIGLFAVGCFTFSDYGLFVDEAAQHNIGEVNYNFIKNGNTKELLACDDKYHGPAFEIFLYAAEKLVNVTEVRSVFLLRHALNFLVFFIGTYFFYLLGFKLFKSRGIGLLCSVLLVASPRIYSDSFYDSKDLIMLSLCIISTYTTFLFLERQTIWLALIHALCCGLTIDVRIMGLLIPIATIYLFVMQKNKRIIPLLFFVSYTLLFTIAFWPVLWINPVLHFIGAFKQMSHFPQPISMLYRGGYVSTMQLPWHYLPFWLLISTPLFYILLFFTGLFFAVKNTLQQFLNTLHIQFFLFMFATPIMAVIILNSTVYDSWHHVFFVYPYFLLIAVYGFTELIPTLKNKSIPKIIIYSTILSIAFTLTFMIVNHPFQNVYFNLLAGKNVRENFELDYAGMSYRQGLEYILANDKSPTIHIAATLGECQLNFSIIPAEDRKRLFWTDNPETANYYLSNFRWHPTDYKTGTSVFQVNVGNEKIMEVLKLR